MVHSCKWNQHPEQGSDVSQTEEVAHSPHWYGQTSTAAMTKFSWEMYDGSVYRNLTTSGNTLSYGGNDLIHASSPQLTSKLDKTGGTLTGTLVMNNARIELTSNQAVRWCSNEGFQSMDGRVNGTNVDLHCYGSSTNKSNTGMRWQLFDGSAYRLLTTSGDTLSYGGNDLVHRGMPQYAVTDVTTSRNLTLADIGKLIRLSSVSVTNLTIPNDSSVVFPVGTTIGICNRTSVQHMIVRASGVLLSISGSYTSDADRMVPQYGYGRLIKLDVNYWSFVPNTL